MQTQYPLQGEGFEYSTGFSVGRILIGSLYNITTEQHDGDVMDIFRTFSFLEWFYVLSILFLFYVALKISKLTSNPTAQQPGGPCWIVTTFVLDQDNLNDDIRWNAKIISFMLSVFTFFVVNWLLNTTNTDLKTVDDPRCILNYDDIMRHNALPVWSSSSRTIDMFKMAPEGTVQKDLWKYAIKKGGIESIFIKIDMKAAPVLMKKLTEQSIVLLGAYNTMKMIGIITCKLLREDGPYRQPDIYALYTSDPRFIPITQTTVMSSKIPIHFKNYLIRRITGYWEFGLQKSFNSIAFYSVVSWSPDIEECLSFTKPLKNNPTQPLLGFYNIIKLIVVFFSGLIIAGMFLIRENYIKRANRRERKRGKKTAKRQKTKRSRSKPIKA